MKATGGSRPVKISVKDAAGRVKAISPAAFRRLFNTIFTARLIAPAALPVGYLVHANEVDRQTAKELGASRHDAIRRGIRAGHIARVYVSKVSDEIGNGLYAYRNLRPGDMIGEYAGILTRDWVADIKKPSDHNPYLLRYPFECSFAIDAREKGNVTRFINHSTRNANVRRHYVLEGGLLHAVFAADKQIAKDTQLFLDYGKRYWQNREPSEIEG